MELRALTGCALEPDPAAMHLDDLAGDWQTKAGTDTPIHTIGGICVWPTVSNKQSVIKVDRHTWTLVVHGYLYGFGIRSAGHQDVAAGGRVFDRVIQQSRECLRNSFPIA